MTELLEEAFHEVGRLNTEVKRQRAEIERLREVLAVIASGGTKYDSAADLIRIAARALEPKP